MSAVTEQSLVVVVHHMCEAAEGDHAEETAVEHTEHTEAVEAVAVGLAEAETPGVVQAVAHVGRTVGLVAVLEHSKGTAVAEFESG